MKTKFLIFLTLGLLFFTTSAFSLVIVEKNLKALPFAILGFVLLMVFQKELRTSKDV